MYLKLSFFFLLVGLINQTIATKHQENETTNSTIPDESTIPNFTTSTKETPNTINNFAKATNSSKTTDFNDRFHYANFMYRKKCSERGNSSIFDLDLLQGIKKQTKEPLNHAKDSLSLDETKKEIETLCDSIIDALNASDSEIAVSFNQAAERFVYIILSGKKSDLKQIIHIITKSSKKFMDVITTHNEDIRELIQSMNNKIAISAMMKENPSISTYLLDLLLSIMRVIDRYEEQGDFNEMVGALRSTLGQAKKDIMKSQISNDTEIVRPLIKMINFLAYKIPYTFRLNISNEAKFRSARCLTEDAVMTIFMRAFMITFYAEIDS